MSGYVVVNKFLTYNAEIGDFKIDFSKMEKTGDDMLNMIIVSPDFYEERDRSMGSAYIPSAIPRVGTELLGDTNNAPSVQAPIPVPGLLLLPKSTEYKPVVALTPEVAIVNYSGPVGYVPPPPLLSGKYETSTCPSQDVHIVLDLALKQCCSDPEPKLHSWSVVERMTRTDDDRGAKMRGILEKYKIASQTAFHFEESVLNPFGNEDGSTSSIWEVLGFAVDLSVEDAANDDEPDPPLSTPPVLKVPRLPSIPEGENTPNVLFHGAHCSFINDHLGQIVHFYLLMRRYLRTLNFLKGQWTLPRYGRSRHIVQYLIEEVNNLKQSAIETAEKYSMRNKGVPYQKFAPDPLVNKII